MRQATGRRPDGKVEMRGKYFAMWRWNNDKQVWKLLATIHTPMHCISESKYCK